MRHPPKFPLQKFDEKSGYKSFLKSVRSNAKERAWWVLDLKVWLASVPKNWALVWFSCRYWRAVTKDPMGAWRVTLFTQEGLPWSHSLHESRSQAAEAAIDSDPFAMFYGRHVPVRIWSEDEIKAGHLEPRKKG